MSSYCFTIYIPSVMVPAVHSVSIFRYWAHIFRVLKIEIELHKWLKIIKSTNDLVRRRMLTVVGNDFVRMVRWQSPECCGISLQLHYLNLMEIKYLEKYFDFLTGVAAPFVVTRPTVIQPALPSVFEPNLLGLVHSESATLNADRGSFV